MNENNKTGQTLSLEDRKTLALTGVCEVETSDEKQVLVKTLMGRLKVTGAELSIVNLNTEEGCLSLTGKINSLEYKETKNSGRISSLFK